MGFEEPILSTSSGTKERYDQVICERFACSDSEQ
jgi:hypothetical protein